MTMRPAVPLALIEINSGRHRSLGGAVTVSCQAQEVDARAKAHDVRGMERRLFIVSTLTGLVAPNALIEGVAREQGQDDPPTLTSSGDPAFDAWRADFVRRSVAARWSADLLERELSGLTPDPQVLTYDARQPEFSTPAGAYIQNAVSATRLETGQARRAELAFLPGLEARYGVPTELLMGIWGMETAFGSVMGDFDVVRSVATLAAQGRRRAFAEAQLYAALRMISTGEASRSQMRGSWAGAMGHTQFIPETYLATAVDGDGDGKRDIWNSPADALASAANLLAKAGWKRGEGWHREVILPERFDFGLAEGPSHPPAWWIEQGARTADGAAFSPADAAAQASLVLPSGAAGPAFLVFPNHMTIRRYNNSTTYALAVGMIADGVAGRPTTIKTWPQEQGLAIADRTGAQEALNRLGYNAGTPDGIIGTNSRLALRGWQKAKGLPADGYLSVDVARRLQAEAAALPLP